MGSSCPWVLHQVSAPEIKLDGTGYVAWGVKTGQGAASKSGLPWSCLEVSATRASACPPHSMPSRTGDDGGPCVHCAADWASLWRENDRGEDVCKLADCWRLEKWLPPLVRKLKRDRAQGGSSAPDAAEPVQVVQHAVTLKKIIDIYGHRYCNPTLFDPLDPRRRAPVEKTALEYLIYGNFKSDDVANDPGMPDQRWMSLDDVLDAVGKRSAENKLKAYEFELVQSRVTALEVERE